MCGDIMHHISIFFISFHTHNTAIKYADADCRLLMPWIWLLPLLLLLLVLFCMKLFIISERKNQIAPKGQEKFSMRTESVASNGLFFIGNQANRDYSLLLRCLFDGRFEFLETKNCFSMEKKNSFCFFGYACLSKNIIFFFFFWFSNETNSSIHVFYIFISLFILSPFTAYTPRTPFCIFITHFKCLYACPWLWVPCVNTKLNTKPIQS